MRGLITFQPRKWYLLFCCSIALIVCLVWERQPAWGEDTLKVKQDSDKTVYTIGATDEKNNALNGQRDKEKNVYSIGPSKEKRKEAAKKEERSWDMLMNMGILHNNSEDRRHHPPRAGKGRSLQQNQPSQEKSELPAASE